MDLIVPTPEAMDALGARLAPLLAHGDLIALSGPLGAGKSHLARAMIRARLGDPMAEVPSPTYTLVNVYDTTPQIWHADLYRLSDAEELLEIGLEDALGDAIVLIEWAERWPGLPSRRLGVEIAPAPDGARTVTLTAHGDGWGRVLDALNADT